MVIEPLEARVLFSADLIPLTQYDVDQSAGLEPNQSATLLLTPGNNANGVTPDAEYADREYALAREGINPKNLPVAAGAHASDAPESTNDLTIQARTNATELVFVDYRVPEAQSLVDAIKHHSEDLQIVVLNADDNGIDIISNKIQQTENIAAIHIISHGSDGHMYLGSQVLNPITLEQRVETIGSWQHSLTDDADILIYGCEVAASDYGQTFIDTLAEVTGADVTASDDTTGHTELGGDWHFEYTVGSVEAELALSHTVQASYYAALATVTVDATADLVNGDTSSIAALIANDGGDGISLREAVMAAVSSFSIPDTIIINSGTYTLNLSGTGNNLGDLDINSDIDIIGAADGSTIIDASALNDRVFHVQGGEVTFTNLTITGGSPTDSPGGGGILVAGSSTAVLDSVVLSGNTAVIGGGLRSSGDLTVVSSTFDDNHVTTKGGGIAISGGTAVIQNSTISNNTAVTDGGGIRAGGSNVTFENATISGNYAANGGGFQNDGATASFQHATIANNNATGAGGGVRISSGTASLENSIVADNQAGTNDDVEGSLNLLGSNIIGSTPGLALNPLTDNGGGVQTHALAVGSDGIDTGSGSSATDARGYFRDDGNVDIGAFELGAAPPLGVGLVGHYQFDENGGPIAIDSSSSGQDGTLVNAPIWSTDSAVGSYSLDLSSDAAGNNAYVEVTDNAAQDFGAGDYTISVWYNQNGTPTQSVRLLGDLGSTAPGFVLYTSASGTLDFLAFDGVFNHNLSATAVNDGNWHLATVTYDAAANTFKLYQDGIEVDSLSAASGNINTSIPLTIGATSATATNDFEGKIDDVRLYNRALSAGEIQQLLAVNETPEFVNLDANPTYTENGPPVVLDADATIYDPVLSAIDNFDGSELTVGLPSLNDQFGINGIPLNPILPLTVQGVNIGSVGFITIAPNDDVSQTFSFNGNATTALVNDFIQSLTLTSFDDTPPPSFDINWLFDNGPTGGDLTTEAITTLNFVAVNDTPATNNLDNTPTFIENGAAVVLDPDVAVFDAELSEANNFNEATIYIGRTGGANADDVFSASGLLAPLNEGGSVVFNGTNVGTAHVNSGGELIIQFNVNATQANVDGVLQAISYSNTNDTPPASVTLTWVFDDNNSGSQGLGGPEFDAKTISVDITPANDAPIVTNNGGSVDQGTYVTITPAMLQASDPDDSPGDLTYTTSNVTNGQIEISGSPGTPITSFTQSQVNNGNIVFLHDGSGTTTASFDFSLADGGEDGAAPVTGIFNFVVNPANDAPVFTQLPANAGQTVDNSITGASSTEVADINGDGNLDLITTSATTGKIIYYPGDGTGSFGSGTSITNTLDEPMEVDIADIDNDGDLDIIAADYSTSQDNLMLYKNDGNGNFTSSVIDTALGGVVQVDTGDLDGDGDIDAAATFWFDNEIVWYENDGTGTFSRTVIGTANTSVEIADVNSDGALDVLATSRNTNEVVWLENNGNATGFIQHGIPVSQGYDVTATDLDGDGDTDLAYAGLTGAVGWLENDGGVTPGFTDHPFTNIARGESISTADIDSDGDQDILATRGGSGSEFLLYENDGAGNFTSSTFATASNAKEIIAADLDNDGDLEVITSDAGFADVQVFNNYGNGAFASAITNEDTAVTLDPVVVSDIDAGSASLAVNILVSNGTINLAGISGLSFTTGSGSNDSALTFTGNLTDLNAALSAIEFTPDTNFNGEASVAITVDDQGNTGTGGSMSAMETLFIEVLPVNDAPLIGGFVETWLADETPLTQTSSTSFHANAGHQTAQITIDGQNYYHGIGIHPGGAGSVTEYALNGATGFAAVAGLNDSLISGGEVIFRVYLDGVEVFNSGNVTHSTPAVPVLVDTTGASVLRLEVDTAGSAAADHAVWADAKLTGTTQSTAISVAETAVNGTLVGTYIGSDPEPGDTLTYSLTNDPTGRFTIDPGTGEITVADASQLDFEATNSHPVTVRIDDGTTTTDHPVTINITNINEEPTGTDDTISITEDSSYTLQYGDFGFTDPEGDTMVSIHVASLPSTGTLTLNGSAVNQNAVILATDFPNLEYTPASHGNGIGYDSFDFTVRDSQQLFAANTNTLTFNVLPVNDAPDGSNNTFTLAEDTTHTFAPWNFGFSDWIESDGFQSVFITTLPANGVVELNTIAVTTGQEIPVADIVNLVYTPDANLTGVNADSFTFQVRDDGGTISGGVDTDQDPDTITFDISPVNDAPVLSTIEALPASYIENSTAIGITGNLSVTDVDDTNIESAVVAISNYVNGEDVLTFSNQSGITGSWNATTGELSLTGSATRAQYESALHTVAYQNNSDNPNTTPRTISFTVNDGDDNSNTISRDIAITAVNDAPITDLDGSISAGSDYSTTYTEGDPAVNITASDASFSDIEGDEFNSLSITLTGFLDGNDEHIFLGNIIFGYTNPANTTAVVGGTTFDISFSGTDFTITNNAGGVMPQSDLTALLQNIRFRHIGDTPGIGDRQLQFVVVDENMDASPIAISTVSVGAINTAPTFDEPAPTLDGNPTFIEDSPAVILDTNVELFDAEIDAGLDDYDGTTLMLQRNGGANSEDILSIDLASGLGISFISGGGAPEYFITYNGERIAKWHSYGTSAGTFDIEFINHGGHVVTTAEINTVLQHITYSNNSDAPPASVQIDWSFNDNNDGSQGTGGPKNVTGNTVVNITPNNDAPVLSSIEALPASYTENDTPIGITGNLSVADVDDANIESAVIAIGNYINGEDVLSFTDLTDITGSWDAAAGTLTLMGSATKTQYESALHTVTYHNLSDSPDTTTRTVSFTVNDGDDNSNTLSRDINITEANDSPLFSVSGLSTLTAIDEDNMNSSGDTVADIIASAGHPDAITDADTGAVEGIALSSVDTANGIWQYQSDGSSVWNNIGSPSSSAALLLNDTARIRFVPNPDFAGNAGIQYRAWDQTSGNEGDTVSVAGIGNTGGSNSVGIAIDSATITVNPVNDAPALASIEALPAVYVENSAPLGITGNMTLNDVDDTNIESATVTISGNFAASQDELLFTNQAGISGSFDPANGVLTLTGSAAAVDYQTALRTVAYNNTSNNPSTLTRTVTFEINDGDDSSNSLGRSIDFTAINDPPLLTATETTPASYIENDVSLNITSATSISDIDDTHIEGATVSITANFAAGEDVLGFANQAGITGTYNPSLGIILLNGTATLSDYQTVIQSITYENTSDNPSDLTRSVSFVIYDGDDNSNTVSRDITFTAINDAPVLASIEALPAVYVENSAPLGITGNITLNDVDDTNIESASVTISGNFAAGQDELLFTNQSGITGSFNSTSGILSLSGSASVADYQAALRTVTYNNSSNNPSALTRTVTFEINDGDDASNNLNREIDFTAINDAPVLSGTETTPVSYTENDVPLNITSSTGVNDLDDTHIESATVSITGNFAAGEDLLGFNNMPGITGIYNPATGVMTLSGTATLADYQTALQSITYANTSDDPSDLTRTVSFVLNDGDDNSNNAERDIAFVAINDAPVLANIEALPAVYVENGTALGITGNMTLNDVDDTNIESAFVTISGNFAAGQDELLFTNQSGITGSFNSTSGILSLSGSASVADYQTALRTVTYNNTSSNPSALTRTVTFEISDGDAASNNLSREIDFTAVNDAPTISGTETATASYTENDVPLNITSSTSVNDLDDTHIESATVSITANFAVGQDVLSFTNLPGITGSYDLASGVLSLNGSATLADYQMAIQSITYANISDDPSELTRTISIVVNDGNDNSNTAERNIEFVAVNDAPVLSAIEILPTTFTENGIPIGITGSLSITDIDDTHIESARVFISSNFTAGEDELGFIDQSGITGNYNAATGTMTLTGSAAIADYETALRTITFANTSNNPSVLTRTVSFEINDGDVPGNILSRDINFNLVNDAPVLTSIESAPASYTEDALPVGITGNLNLTDPDDTFIESATVSISSNFTIGEDLLNFTNQTAISGTYNASTGVMTLSGSGTIADYEAAIRSVTYENTSDNANTASRTISIEIHDGDTNSNTVNRDIEIYPINDAPTLTGIEALPATYNENNAPVVITGALSVSDIDDTNIESARIAINGNFSAGEDVLGFIDQNGITGSYNASNGVLNLTGTASVAAYQAALQSVTYENSSDNPSTVSRTIEFVVNDSELNSNLLYRDIAITAANDLPQLSAIESTPLIFVENGAPAAVTSNILISDVDDTDIQSATVMISSNYAAGSDWLIFNNQSGVSGNFDSGTGILTLSGNASLQDYESALRDIAFINTSENPTAGSRTVEFSVADNTGSSNTVSRLVDIVPSNDAPEIIGLEINALAYQENSIALPITNTLTLADLDDVNLESATVVISGNFFTGQDQLTFTDQNGITGSYNAQSGVLILSGSATLTHYEEALRSVSYSNNSDNPAELTRTIDFQVDDGSTVSNVGSRDMTVMAINDRPVLLSLESDPLIYTENQLPVAITESLLATDLDDSTLQSASVKITSNYNIDQDNLLFTPTGNISGVFDTNTGELLLSGTATLSDYQDAIRAVTYVNTSDTPSTLPRTIAISFDDIDSTSNTGNRELIIQGVNDAPAGSDSLISLLEDSSYVLSTADFGFVDALDQHAFAGIVIQKPPSLGTLTLRGDNVNVGQIIPAIEISVGDLVFTPEPDAAASDYDNFEFRVFDNGGTDLDGVDTSVNANTISFSINDVNDAPVGTDKSILVTEDNTLILSRDDFGFSDVLDGDQFTGITVSSIPNNGLLTLSGIPIQVGWFVDISAIESGLFQYTPANNENGINNSFSFTVHDDGGAENGGEFVSATESYINFNLIGVNDPPLLLTETINVDEGSENTVTTEALNALDADDPSPDELTFTINSLPSNGTLTLNGLPVTTGASFTLEQLQSDQLQYKHDGSETSQDFFDLQLSDGGEDGSQPVNGRLTLVINEVIDPAPVIDNESIVLEFGGNFDSLQGSQLESGKNSLATDLLSANQQLIVSLETPPSQGSVELNSDGTFTYQHDGGVVLQDSFSYRVTNEDGVSTVADVSINIEPPLASAFDNPDYVEAIVNVPSPVSLEPAPELEIVVEQFGGTDQPEENELPEETTADEEPDTTEAAEAIDQSPTGSDSILDLGIDINIDDTSLTNSNTATISEVQIYDLDQNELMFLSRDRLIELGVQRHNNYYYTAFDHEVITISTAAFNVLNDVNISRPQDVVANKQFLEGLQRLGRDFENSEESNQKRYQLASDTGIGVSLSATAGILAWALRGGALFASVMAYTPIWSSIDPVRVMGGSREQDQGENDSEVEKLFS